MTREQKNWIDAHPDYRIVPDRIAGHVAYVKRVFLNRDGKSFVKVSANATCPAGSIELGIMKNEPPTTMETTVKAGEAFK